MNDVKQIICDECGEEVINRLVEVDGAPKKGLACGCHIFSRTQGIHRPFKSDLPDKWWSD